MSQKTRTLKFGSVLGRRMWCVVQMMCVAVALVLAMRVARAKVKLPENVTITAVFTFGDSITDTGNNNFVNGTLARCNFPPYGRDFEGGIPTGRFTNGRTPSDLYAEEFGIKKLLPPYLDPATFETKDFITGVTFASGGAGFDPLTSNLVRAISLSRQLEMLKELKGKVRRAVGDGRATVIMKKAIFIVTAGSNDIANLYLHTPFRISQYNNFSAYADFLCTSAANFVKELYLLGGRVIGVTGLPPIGCLPSQITLAGRIETPTCVHHYNRLALHYNSKLTHHLKLLTKKLVGAKIAYIDIYQHFLDIIDQPHNFGFEVTNRGCCGTGLIETVFLCNEWTPFTCSNSSKFVFWDSYHPTEKFYKIVIPNVAQRLVDMIYDV